MLQAAARPSATLGISRPSAAPCTLLERKPPNSRDFIRAAESLSPSCSPSKSFVASPLATSHRRGRTLTCKALEGMQGLEMWNMYNESVDNNPEILRSATTLFGFVVGDLFAQRALRVGLAPTLPSKVRLKKRGGLLGRLWYTFLDRRVFPDDPAGLVAVMSRTTSFSAMFAPLFIAAFFALLKLLQGHPELMWVSVEEKLFQTAVTNYLLWPLAHCINFKYVPPRFRSLFNNYVLVLWNLYLSFLWQDGPLAEESTVDEELITFVNEIPDLLRTVLCFLPVEMLEVLPAFAMASITSNYLDAQLKHHHDDEHGVHEGQRAVDGEHTLPRGPLKQNAGQAHGELRQPAAAKRPAHNMQPGNPRV